MEVKLDVSLNALFPMLVKLGGMVMEVKLDLLNALAPMLVTYDGSENVTEVKFVLSLNAIFPMAVTL